MLYIKDLVLYSPRSISSMPFVVAARHTTRWYLLVPEAHGVAVEHKQGGSWNISIQCPPCSVVHSAKEVSPSPPPHHSNMKPAYVNVLDMMLTTCAEPLITMRNGAPNPPNPNTLCLHVAAR